MCYKRFQAEILCLTICCLFKNREIAVAGWRHKGYFCVSASNHVSVHDCLSIGQFSCYIQVC